MSSCIFTNDNNIEIKLLDHIFTEKFRKRDNHEVIFRKINTYLINNNIILKNKNIIDLGAWVGDNSIPWAKNIYGTIYAIDPSPDNISFINNTCKLNDIKNVQCIQGCISDKNELLSTNDSLDHCSFVYGNTGVRGRSKVRAVTLDFLFNNNYIENIGYIHLDVEGMEYKVLLGSKTLINSFKPIISFEQHLDMDNYNLVLKYLLDNDYVVYLIDEILPGCRPSCRNSLAFHKSIFDEKIIENINKHIGRDVMIHYSLLSKYTFLNVGTNNFECVNIT